MTLSLPADAEPFIPEGEDLSALREPGVYALTLRKPDGLATAWDDTFDARPDYWGQLTRSDGVVYVGAASDVLRRLEEHRDGEVRLAALLRVCPIESLRTIWWFDDADTAFEREQRLAMLLQNDRPDLYVHAR